jgi:two-component system, LytTR family, sensor kinase
LNNNFKYWACQVLGWGSFAALSIYQTQANPVANQYEIIADILFAIYGLLITHFVRLRLYKNNWNNLPIEKLLGRVLLVVIVQSSFLLAFYSVSLFFLNKIVFEAIGKSKYVGFFFTSLLLTFTWTLLYFIIKFIERNRMLVIERLQMENSVKSLEIKTIKNNLQPHFIFNALNSIRALVDEDPARARQSITQLSNILRSSIMVDKIETVPMKKELEIVKDYLSLEGIRYEERLHTLYEVQDNTLELPVPPLMLQTLVENAIKHGIAAEVGGGFVELKSFIASNQHQIIIRNTGKYDPGNSTATTSNGFGLESTRDRLQFVFSKKATLEIHNEEKNIVALKICIPLLNN